MDNAEIVQLESVGHARKRASSFRLAFVLKPDSNGLHFPAEENQRRETRKEFASAEIDGNLHVHSASRGDELSLSAGWMGRLVEQVFQQHKLAVVESLTRTAQIVIALRLV